MGQVASGRGARFIETGFGFQPFWERDREIVRGAIRDVIEHFGLSTVEQLDQHLTVLYGKDATGQHTKIATVSPPSR